MLRNVLKYAVPILALAVLPPSYIHAQDTAVPTSESPKGTQYHIGRKPKWTLDELHGYVVSITDQQYMFKAADVELLSARKGMEIEFSPNFSVTGKENLVELFEIILKQQGFVTEEVLGDKTNIKKVDRSVKTGPTKVIKDIAELDGRHSGLVTHVREIENTSPTSVANALKLLLDPTAETLLPLQGTNTLVITAYPQNVIRIENIIEIMDKKSEKVEVKSYTIGFADADQLAQNIRQVLENMSRLEESNAGGRNNNSRRVQATVIPDSRTNTLMVIGLPEHFPVVEDVMKELDVYVEPQGSQIKIIHIRNRKAEDVVETITGIYENKREIITEVNEGNENANAAPARPQRPSEAGGGGGSADQAAARPDVIPQLSFDRDTNTVIAVSAFESAFEELDRIIGVLDKRQPQVFIEVSILEVGRDSERQLGMELLNLAQASPGTVRGFAATSFGQSTIDTDNPTGGRSPLVVGDSLQSGLVAGIFKDSAEKIPLLLRAVKNNSDSKLIDMPSILVRNNQEEATFSSTEEVSTRNTDSTNTSTTTSFGGYEQAETTLIIRNPLITRKEQTDDSGEPRIDGNGNVMSDFTVQFEIDQTTERFTTESTDPALPPAKATRSVNTEVIIPDGATIVIGGVSSIREQKAIDSVPYVVDMVNKLPVLGSHVLGPVLDIFFERSVESKTRSTMYMFVTPHIIYDVNDLNSLSDRVLKEEDIDVIREKWGIIGGIEQDERDEKAEKRKIPTRRGFKTTSKRICPRA